MHKKPIQVLIALVLILSVTMMFPAHVQAQSLLEGMVEGFEDGEAEEEEYPESIPAKDIGDGIYIIEASLTGGDGSTGIETPISLNISGIKANLLLVWNTDDCTLIRVGAEEYEAQAGDGRSVFEIPVEHVGEPVELTLVRTVDGSFAETEYILDPDLLTIEKDGMNPRTMGMIFGVVIGIAACFIMIKLPNRKQKTNAKPAKIKGKTVKKK